MTATFCTTGGATTKAGANANATIVADTTSITRFIEQAQAYICAAVRYDYATNYSSLAATTKQILEQAAEDIAAIYIIQYDMSGYSSRTDAQVQLDVLTDRSNRALKLLEDQNLKNFMLGV